MHKFINNFCFSRILNFTLAAAIPVTTVFYPSKDLHAFGHPKEAIFLANIANLIKKLEGSKGKDNKKVASALLALRNYIEESYGIKFNMDTALSDAYLELKQRGIVVPKDQLLEIANILKVKNLHKKIKNLSVLEGGEGALFDLSDNIAEELINDMHSKNSKENKESLNGSLFYGISLILGGAFLICLPLPYCKEAGKYLAGLGLGMVMNGVAQIHDERKDDKPIGENPGYDPYPEHQEDDGIIFI